MLGSIAPEARLAGLAPEDILAALDRDARERLLAAMTKTSER